MSSPVFHWLKLMKILLDTSILFPGFRHPELRRKLIWKLLEQGATPVSTDYILEELRVNIARQFSNKQAQVALNLLLQIIQTGEIEVKTFTDYAEHLTEARGLIREKDAPILAAVMLPDIDYLVTRDKRDFLEKNQALRKTPWIEKIKSPAEILSLLEQSPDNNND